MLLQGLDLNAAFVTPDMRVERPGTPYQVHEGIYVLPDVDCGRQLPFLNHADDSFDSMYQNSDLRSQGIVDTPEQFFDLFYEDLETDPRTILALLYEVDREYPLGWRYERWGTYYGTQNPQGKYLTDDAHIERVFVFNLYDLTGQDIPALIEHSARIRAPFSLEAFEKELQAEQKDTKS